MSLLARNLLSCLVAVLVCACGEGPSDHDGHNGPPPSDRTDADSSNCEEDRGDCPPTVGDDDATSDGAGDRSTDTTTSVEPQPTTPCDPDEPCPLPSEDAECANGEGCEPTESCEEGECGTSAGSCALPDDCLDNETCEDGRCIPAGTAACGEEDPCPDGERCEEGQCVPGGSGPCLDDGDCPEESDCVAGECVQGPDPPCQQTEDCGEGEQCLEGECSPVETPDCTSAEDCDPGQACIDDACVDPPGCTSPEDCAEGEQCDQGTCVPTGPAGCAEDDDCGEGERCARAQCVPVVVCASSGECGPGEECRDGACVEVCLETSDCLSGFVCDLGDCIENPASHIRFVSFVPEGLEEHRFRWNPGDPLGFGAGFAFFDMNGNGLPDLFTGGDAGALERACIWRNVSSPGEPRFEPVEAFCGTALTGFLGAFSVDIDGDGRDELILLGDGRAALLRFHPEPLLVDLVHPRLNPGSLERCEASSAAWLDIDLNGRPELVIACILPGIAQLDTAYDLTNLLFGVTDDHLLEAIELTDAELLLGNDPMRVPGSTQIVDGPGGATLAFGIVDLNGNGLPDVVVVNDSFSTPHERFPSFERGYALLRCPPDTDCTWSSSLFSEGPLGWGAFMGAAHVRLGNDDWIYLTDWGPNHLIRVSADGLVAAEADARGAALAERDGEYQISWSPLVDDFTGNGLDDILVSQGVLPNGTPPEVAVQVHTLLAQVEGGRFAELAEELGFRAPQPEHHIAEAIVRDAARGAARLDLDGSGDLHVVVAVLDGPLQFYRLEHIDGAPHPRRCTLDPINSVVPSRAWGYAISDASGTDFRTRDIQGQMRASPPGTLLTEHTEGILRFPSGWEEPFVCTPGEGPVTIIEPDWITASGQGELVRFQVERSAHLEPPATVEVLTRDAAGTVTRHQALAGQESGEWTVTAPDAQHAMLVLDGFHVARWWPVPRD